MQQSTNHSWPFPREALSLPIHHFPIINKGALHQALALLTAHSSLQILNDLAGWKARPTVEFTNLAAHQTPGKLVKNADFSVPSGDSDLVALEARLQGCILNHWRGLPRCGGQERLYGEGEWRLLKSTRQKVKFLSRVFSQVLTVQFWGSQPVRKKRFWPEISLFDYEAKKGKWK